MAVGAVVDAVLVGEDVERSVTVVIVAGLVVARAISTGTRDDKGLDTNLWLIGKVILPKRGRTLIAKMDFPRSRESFVVNDADKEE